MPQTASRCQSTRAGMKNSWLANPWLTPSALHNGGSSNSVNRMAWGSSLSNRWHCSGTPTNAQNWDYDAVGNWDSITTNSTTQTRGANRQNEITSVSGATAPTYDNNGNLTKDENDYRFVYDAWNRLVQIKNSSNTVIATNAFDGLNRKAQVTTSSGTIDRIFSSDWQVLEEKSGSNTKNRYVWSPAYVDALVLRDRDTDSNGTLEERLYSLQDANWNTTALVNTTGTVQERFTYSPFGVVTFRDASGASIGASAKDWLFLHQGGQTDSIGNYDFRNRIYSPTLGRWLTNDPLGFAAGDVSFYRYVGNGPGNGLDPSGFEEGYWYDYFLTIPAIFRWSSEAGRSRDLDQRLGDIKEKQLKKRDILDWVMKVPFGNETAGEIRNSTFDPNFNVYYQQAKGDIRAGGQIIKAQWDYFPIAGAIFTKQMLSQSKIIAIGTEIKKIELLVGRFGGLPNQWKKKAGIDANGQEWHWYEYKGKKYGEKRNGEFDPF